MTNNYDADVSLLQFEERSIHFSAYIQPICIFDPEQGPVANEGIVAGWGQSEDKTKDHENLPKMTTARIQANEECFLGTKGFSEISSKRTFCAGLKNGSGVCMGDSGGGLFIKANEVYYLKGIISSSLINTDGDCDVLENSVYTDVPKFINWIEKITSIPFQHSVCGKAAGTSSMIRRGQAFARGSFPWLAALKSVEYNPPKFFCGGSIISSTFVLSGNLSHFRK